MMVRSGPIRERWWRTGGAAVYDIQKWGQRGALAVGTNMAIGNPGWILSFQIWFISWKIPKHGWFISWKIRNSTGWWLGVPLWLRNHHTGNFPMVIFPYLVEGELRVVVQHITKKKETQTTWRFLKMKIPLVVIHMFIGFSMKWILHFGVVLWIS